MSASAKRQAFAVVANMIAECRRARAVIDGQLYFPTGESQAARENSSEAAVLRELEKIETAMRDASQVRP